LAANVRHDSRVHLIAPLPSLIHCSHVPASADELMQRAQETFKPIPSMVPAVKGNAVTREEIELGKMLFFDTRLSASQIIKAFSQLAGNILGLRGSLRTLAD
jgi:cytochrome c peroxidase